MKTILAMIIAVIISIVSLVYPIYWLAGLSCGLLLGHLIGMAWMTYHFEQIAPEEYAVFRKRELNVIRKGLDVISKRL